MIFPTNYGAILDRISQVNPLEYSHSRNYTNGAVTYLSPYISRGVISTKMVWDSILAKYPEPEKIERFLQELAWRNYWQHVWINKGFKIDLDLKSHQENQTFIGLPKSVFDKTTSIEAIDIAIDNLYSVGYVHNHQRMYLASVCCNIGQYHWNIPAKWMYYYLLGGD